jgi:formylglycine-generating enzyme required for sulfatase activity
MKKILLFVALLGLNDDPAIAAVPIGEDAKKFVAGYDFLKQHKYQEARTAFEANLQKNPADTMAHFYLGDACRGLKAWTCAELHYETSVELNAKSPVAGLAKQRGRKAKVWRLLDEGKQAINEWNVSPVKIAQAEDTLDIASKLGLDDEQQACYRQVQEKILEWHKRSHEKIASAQPEERSMAVVPAGEFIMGSSTGDPDEQPVHRVYMDAFLMDKYEVTVEQYAAFLQAKWVDPPMDWKMMNQPSHQKRPVVNVDWPKADAYCKWVGKRLPTEAEWEKAARGTDGRFYPWGNELPTRVHANLSKETWSNHWVLSTVGMYEDGKSPYGIYDMAGNVWEWVSDWYDQDYYKASPVQNPTGPSTGGHKVIRGGSWGSGEKNVRSTDRNIHLPSFRGLGTGFRCAKTL